MLIIVTFISTLVHLYSTDYMEYDPHINRFMSYLSLFTFFMLILVTSNNFLQMFVGWEGVGVCSYLLINFWFTRIQANKAAIKAMLINRIGDFFLLIAIFLIYFTFDSLEYDVVFSLASFASKYNVTLCYWQFSAIDLICLLLLLGAMGKSAQLGLHTWLPDAMEGPTPVSALIHAATMVTAGIFLIIRCSFLFEYSEIILNLMVVIGSITALLAATTALCQNDIKKVIAYSTCSQLGYMFFACGLSSYEVSFFHLSNHAFFKALLFLGAGSIIHAMLDEQDMRKMGGLKNLLPFSYATMVIGSLALTGFPFLTGFYSKDIILEVAFAKYTILGHFSFFLGTLAAFFTAFYSTRLICLVFLSNTNGYKNAISNARESSWKTVLPLFLLALLSISIGFLTKDLFIGFGTDFWNSSIFILPKNHVLLDIEFLDFFYKLLPLIFSLLGIFASSVIYTYELEFLYGLKKLQSFKILYTFFNKKWYFDRIYNQIFGQNLLHLGYSFSYKYLDRGFLEKFGPFTIVFAINNISTFIRSSQNNFIFTSLTTMQTTIACFVLYVAFQNTQIHFENILNEYLITWIIIILFVDLFLFEAEKTNY